MITGLTEWEDLESRMCRVVDEKKQIPPSSYGSLFEAALTLLYLI